MKKITVIRRVSRLQPGDRVDLGCIPQGCRVPSAEEVRRGDDISQDLRTALRNAGLYLEIVVTPPCDCMGGEITGIVV